jgi:hypothetical protein
MVSTMDPRTPIASTLRSRRAAAGICPCCGREVALTFHHLIPRKLHRRPRFRKHYQRGTLNRGIYICRRCHRGIHARYDELKLATHFADLAAILDDPDLQRHFAWVSRQRETSA